MHVCVYVFLLLSSRVTHIYLSCFSAYETFAQVRQSSGALATKPEVGHFETSTKSTTQRAAMVRLLLFVLVY